MDMSVKLNLSYPAVTQPKRPVAENPGQQPQTNTKAASAVEAKSKGDETEHGQLRAAVQEIEKFVQSVKRNLEFSIDETSGKVVVKVIASGSGEVIRQIPSEEVLKLANSLNDASSLLFTAKA